MIRFPLFDILDFIPNKILFGFRLTDTELWPISTNKFIGRFFWPVYNTDLNITCIYANELKIKSIMVSVNNVYTWARRSRNK